MLPLSDHFTHQGQTITRCTQIRLFNGNLPPENECRTSSQCSKWGKRSNSCYHYQIHLLVKNELKLLALKVFSNATYLLITSYSISECSKWGKGANHVLTYQITLLVKDRLSQHALKYVYSKATYLLKMSPQYPQTVDHLLHMQPLSLVSS